MIRLATIISLSLALSSRGQEPVRTDIDPARITDDIVPFQDDDNAYEELYENYLQLYAHPLDINSATTEQLRQLGILNERQIGNLVSHIQKNGKLLSIYELQSISDFDTETLHRLAPMITVVVPGSRIDGDLVKRIVGERNKYFLTRYERTLERSEGHRSTDPFDRFEGGAGRLCMRFKSSRTNEFSYGFITENDAGENFRWDPGKAWYGFDRVSWHVQLMNKGRIENLVVGDFQAQLGQGLILGTAFGTGKGGETITTVRKANTGFMPFTSLNETGNLHGAAATVRINKSIFLSPFVSATRRDAAVYFNGHRYFSSFINSGLHRNANEMRNRKAVGEKIYGVAANVRRELLDAGVVFQQVEYEYPLEKFRSAYNQFAFRGGTNLNVSAYTNYTFGNTSFFAEGARSLPGGTAIVAGMLTSFSRQTDIACLYRHYAANFYPFYGNAFSEGTASQNERGFYFGLRHRFSRKYSFAGYADIFAFPWLKYRVYAPSKGHEFLSRFDYQPSRKALLFFQFRQEQKPVNVPRETVYLTAPGVKRNFVVSCEYEPARNLKLKTRAQYSTVDFDGRKSDGTVLFQDVSFSSGRWSFSGRYAFFETDNFDNRHYVYERDVWSAYSLPVYEGWGLRKYGMITFRVTGALTLSCRYAKTDYRDRTEIGSGLAKINGNSRNDVKLQLVFRFE